MLLSFRRARVLSLSAAGFVAIGLGVVGCSPAPSDREAVSAVDHAAAAVSPASLEASRNEVIEAHAKLVRSFESADVEGFVALLDPGPDLLIFHPFVENRFDGADEVRESLPRMFGRIGEASWSDIHPSVVVLGDTAWLTTHVLIKSPNLPTSFIGRGTEIWTRHENGWLLTHGHWSEHAQLAGAER